MDPASIAFIMAIVLWTFFGLGKMVVALTNSKPKALDYDKRWEDAGYVKMVHDTRRVEAENGISLSECLCFAHRAPASPVPLAVKGAPIVFPEGSRVKPMERAGVMKNNNGRITFHPPKPSPTYKRVVDGYTFNLPNEVPKNAFGYTDIGFDHNVVYGYFKWMDENGQIRIVKSIALPDIRPEYYLAYGDRNRKRISNFTSARHIRAKGTSSATISTGPR